MKKENKMFSLTPILLGLTIISRHIYEYFINIFLLNQQFK
jgi:hypothetical protein